MKNNFFSALAAFGIMLGATMSWGQSTLPKALVGTPDKYQDYFVFNKFGNMDVSRWLVHIYEIVPTSDSTVENRLRERITISDHNYFLLSERYKNTSLHVKISGVNNVGTVIAYDEWEFLAEEPGATWGALCSATCVGPTYSYTIRIDAEFENGVRTNNNTFHYNMGWDENQPTNIGNFGGNPPGVWRNFNDDKKYVFCQNGNIPGTSGGGGVNNYDNIEAPRHHGHTYCPDGPGVNGTWNGVDFVFVPAANNNGFTYKMYDGTAIPVGSNVWRVRKSWGKWGEFKGMLTTGTHFLYPNGFGGDSPEGKCGTFPQSGLVTLPQLNQWNYYLEPHLQKTLADGTIETVSLVCEADFTGGPAPTDPGGSNDGFGKWPFIQALGWWYKIEKEESDSTGNSKPVLEVMQDIQEVYINDFGGQNTTGVSWWPGDDVSMVQIYKVDQNPNIAMNEPITLTLDQVIDNDGNLIPLNFTLHKGLYNIVFFDTGYTSINYLFELNQDVVNQMQKADFVDIVIYPNPFESSNQHITTEIESTINVRYTYTIVDANNNLYHQQSDRMRANDKSELRIRTENLPTGQLFHKFVFDDGSVKILQTLKN